MTGLSARSHAAALRALRKFGLRYPEAHTKSPWPGHLDLAVRDKTFTYLSVDGEPLNISCKLPQSAAAALMLPFTKPTRYGLGRSGWVTAEFDRTEKPPVELLQKWIDESYRAQAPKRLSACLAAFGPERSAPAPEGAKRRPAVRSGSKAGGRKAPGSR